MKRIQNIIIVLLLPLTALLTDCTSGTNTVAKSTSGADEMAKIAKILEQRVPADPALYEWEMRSFVDCAVKGDIDGMILRTSKITIAQTGLEKLKDHYAKDTVPALKLFPNISPGGKQEYFSNGKGDTAWVFQKVFVSANGKEAKFQFVVMKEPGGIVVTSFGPWK